MLAVTLVPTLRSYLQQQNEYSALQAKVRRAAPYGRPADPRAGAQWNDPAYVEQQARERLKFVRAGRAVLHRHRRRPGAHAHAPTPRSPRRRPRTCRTRRGTASCGSPWSSPTGPPARTAPRPPAPAAPPRAPRHRDQQPARPAHPAGGPRRPARRRAAARPARRAASPRWPTAARAARPTCCAPSPGCPTARRSRRRTTPPAPGSPARSAPWRPAGMMREMTDRLGRDPELAAAYQRGPRGLPAPPRPSWATCPRSRASPPAACRPGSSACTCWSATRWPPAPGSTRSATRRSRRCRSGGRPGPACAGTDEPEAGEAEDPAGAGS